MKTFKSTYQDKALNIRSVEYESVQWAEAICLAFSHKKAEEKLITIECIKDKEGDIPAIEEPFSSEKFIDEMSEDIVLKTPKLRKFV